jgi:hypothetical protein
MWRWGAVSLFIGRDKELAILKDQTHKKVASLIIIRSRRRIDKSRLIEEFCRSFQSYKFMGLPPTKETTNQDQINEFLRHKVKMLYDARYQKRSCICKMKSIVGTDPTSYFLVNLRYQ